MIMDDSFVIIDLPNQKQPPQKSVLENLRQYFREYCNATSIHGFRYFGETRSVFEKIWWSLVFCICLILCILTIVTVYKKWDQSPVIVTFATKGKPIYDIPFPAVTVCLESKVNTTVFDYSGSLRRLKLGDNLTLQERTYLSHLSFVCSHQNDFNYTSLNQIDDTKHFFDTLQEVSPRFEIVDCRFLNLVFPCEDLFIPMITDDGFCYAFNILDRTEIFSDTVLQHANFHQTAYKSDHWSMENGYKDGSDLMVHPRRALLSGARYGLRFVLKTLKTNIDSKCRNAMKGYRIHFHAPLRIPRPSQKYIRVPFDRALSATITPSQILTSEAVKSYAARKRQCYFPAEKKLKYFKVYSLVNCDLECLTNFTLFRCGCVLFFMPRENGTRICGAMEYDCIQKAEYELQTLRLTNRIVLKDNTKKPELVSKFVCHCMPMCADLEYSVGSSQSSWASDPDTNSSDHHLSRVLAYFVSSNFIGSERNELYGPTDFLANFGGLLGLFTGFSILSLMEIVYFLSVRLICNARLYGFWAGLQP